MPATARWLAILSANCSMAAVSSRGAKNQVRIRGPKPDVSLQCSSLDNLEKLLQSQVEQGLQSSDPDVVYSQFIFDSTVSLQVDSLPDEWRDTLGSPDGPSPIAVPDAVAQLGDAKTKLKRQRAVARSILKSIQNVDGFNYFEKEAWDTKHLDGYRFKFLCRDSFQNKDRAQNRARSSNASNIESAQAPSAEQSPTSKESRGKSQSCFPKPAFLQLSRQISGACRPTTARGRSSSNSRPLSAW